jgi:pyruvate-formate lyase-activating enzyme
MAQGCHSRAYEYGSDSMKADTLSSPEKLLCIMPTFQCTAECTHCGTLSSPRDRTWLSVEHMHAAIDQAALSGYAGIVFTGGEPTLAGENLLVAMRRAALHGLQVRLVTNAYWASNKGAAERRIDDFVRAGLAEINLSTGDQHARFVPVRNVLYATRAAVNAALGVVIIVETVRDRSITKESIEADEAFKRIGEEFPHAGISVVEWVWSPVSPFTLERYPDNLTINSANVAECQGCDSILSATTVQPDGNISACCGIGMRFIRELRVGNIRENTLAEADLIAAADPLKQRIRKEGPERILAWAAGHDPEIQWENMYAHRCQACIRLFKDPRVSSVIKKYSV